MPWAPATEEYKALLHTQGVQLIRARRRYTVPWNDQELLMTYGLRGSPKEYTVTQGSEAARKDTSQTIQKEEAEWIAEALAERLQEKPKQGPRQRQGAPKGLEK